MRRPWWSWARPAPVRERGGQGERGERGAVTAELAMVIPLLAALTVGLVWLLAVAAAQVRVVDAAREAARSAARGDEASVAVQAARRVAPPNSQVSVSDADGVVTASVSGSIAPPGGLFAFLPGAPVHATAVARSEDSGGGP